MLFADIVAFTALSEAADPEHVKNLVDRVFQRLIGDVVSHGGRVDKIVGDALVALFGAPVAHEDDPERAVRAGLQMQQTLETFCADTDEALELRIGINTGEVLVGALRAGGDYTAMGDTVNVASRLQTAARPGQVLVGPATYAETKDVIRYDPLGPIRARNRTESVEAYAAIAAIAPPGHRPRTSRSPLMGRDRELELLCPALSMAFERNRPHVVVITGEAGMGKSRLAEELARVAAIEHEAWVLEGRCVPYGEANVWWPIASAVKEALGLDDDETPEAMRAKTRRKVGHALDVDIDSAPVHRITEGLLYLVGVPGALDDVEPARARDDATKSFLGLLETIARRRPLVLAISELHWADDLVLELLDRIPPAMRGLPFALLTTSRPELEERWNPKPGRHNVVVLHLDPLDRAGARALVASLLESEPSDELADLLFERSGGNPFFLEELVGLVQCDEEAHLPGNLRAMVATRLDGLGPAERRLVDDAAVVGRMGSLDSLVALDGRDEPQAVQRVIDHLVADDLLGIDGRDWVFRSDLVREVAYETLSKSERARRHAILAGHLIARPDEPVEQLAHHFAASASLVAELGAIDGVPLDVSRQARHWLDRAAKRAEDRDELGAAFAHIERALALGPTLDERRSLLLHRARVLAQMRRLDAARTDALAVLRDASADGDRRSLAMARTELGRIQWAENALVESAATLDEAIKLWRELGDRAGEAEALRARGLTGLFLGELDSAEDAMQQAFDIFTELRDRRGLAWAQQNLAWIAFMRGDPEAAEARIAESVELFEELGDWGGRGWAVGLLAWVRLQRGYLDEADRLGEAVRADLGSDTDRWALGMMSLLLASTRLFSGRTEESLELAIEARAHFDAVNDLNGQLRAITTVARCLTSLGRVAEARELFGEVDALVEASNDPIVRGMSKIVLAAIGIQLGDTELDVPDDIDTLPEVAHVPAAMALLQQGRAAEAVEILEKVWAGATEPGARADVGSASALALAASGRSEEALARADAVEGTWPGTYLDRINLALARGFATGDPEHFDDAIALADGTGDVVSQAMTRLARGRGLGRTEDVTDATARLAAIGVTHTTWDDVYRQAVAA